MRRRALIFGASGQDGPYLANRLARDGWEVWGCIPAWDPKRTTVEDRAPGMYLIEGDLLDPWMPIRVLDAVQPEWVFNLAAITFVPASWGQVELTINSNGVAPVRIMEALRAHQGVRFYQASTSEMFGVSPPPQSEVTPFLPVSPYGSAKLLAHHSVHVFRESYGMFAVSGILFNHESPWRGEEFVTRKVSTQVARWLIGQRKSVGLGNRAAVRDWGHAADYVEAMVMMMERDEPSDFVVGTGVGLTVNDLVEVACGLHDLDPDELFHDDPSLYRPKETAPLIADPTRMLIEGWRPTVSFRAMVAEMIDKDTERVARGLL